MAVKKTAKKAAKKTYQPARKAVPSLKKMSVEELLAVMDARHAQIEAAMAESHTKMEVAMAKSRAETDKAIREALSELSDDVRKTSIVVRELSRNMGGLNNSFGLLVEVVVIPKMRTAINTIGGHSFNRVLVDKKISALVAGEKNTIGEIDMFLFSDAEAMAVEIKAQLNTNHVKERLERLQKFRDYEEEAEIKSKKLFGAMAGVYIDPKAKR